MNSKLTVSTEMLTVSNIRLLGAELLAVVNAIYEDYRNGRFKPNPELTKAIPELITKHTGVVLREFGIVDNPIPDMYVYSFALYGHTGSSFNTALKKPISVGGGAVDKDILQTVIDLDKGFIKGPLTKILTARLYLTSGLFTHDAFTAEEITAGICHEVGHMFNAIANLGEYVWMNYYLTEGVEIVLGKKPNKYRIEFLTPAVLARYSMDPAIGKALLANPTVENVRRAFISSERALPRHHLTAKTFKPSSLREEQLADLFASRQGMGRPLVTFIHKLDKLNGSGNLRSRTSFHIAESIKLINVAIGTALIPVWGIGLAWLIVASSFWEKTDDYRYDVDGERTLKIRYDLVNQLKQTRDPEFQKQLLEDIKVIDGVNANYIQHKTWWRSLVEMASSDRARESQLLHQEQMLERMFNNNLFVTAKQIEHLIQQRK